MIVEITDVDALAQIIRRVDGSNKLGAGALAEAILAALSPAPQTAAARDVLAERRRQVEVEGWTPEHDDQHDQAEMARVAACYAIADTPADEAVYVHGRWRDACDLYWPRLWDSDWWKPTDRRRNLVKAGALILAEIERLDRDALSEPRT